jgi:hypothetical protein
VISGCAVGGALSVGTITVPAGASVRGARGGGYKAGCAPREGGLDAASCSSLAAGRASARLGARPLVAGSSPPRLRPRLGNALSRSQFPPTSPNTQTQTPTLPTHTRPQLIIADQPLAMAFSRITVSGTLAIGTPGCPISSAMFFNVPSGDDANGARPVKRQDACV